MPRVIKVKKSLINRRKNTASVKNPTIPTFQLIVTLIFVATLGLGGIWQSSAEELTASNPAPSAEIVLPAPVAAIQYVRLVGNPLDYLNVRSGPGTSYKLLRQIGDDGVFEYTTIEDGWYRIIMGDGAPGWIYGDYAEILY